MGGGEERVGGGNYCLQYAVRETTNLLLSFGSAFINL